MVVRTNAASKKARPDKSPVPCSHAAGQWLSSYQIADKLYRRGANQIVCGRLPQLQVPYLSPFARVNQMYTPSTLSLPIGDHHCVDLSIVKTQA